WRANATPSTAGAGPGTRAISRIFVQGTSPRLKAASIAWSSSSDRAPGGTEGGKYSEEDQLVGALAIEVHHGPVGGALAGLEEPLALHVEKVEAERPVGHLALTVVEVDLLDELLPGESVDELGG